MTFVWYGALASRDLWHPTGRHLVGVSAPGWRGQRGWTASHRACLILRLSPDQVPSPVQLSTHVSMHLLYTKKRDAKGNSHRPVTWGNTFSDQKQGQSEHGSLDSLLQGRTSRGKDDMRDLQKKVPLSRPGEAEKGVPGSGSSGSHEGEKVLRVQEGQAVSTAGTAGRG